MRPRSRWSHSLVLALALVAGACTEEVPSPEPSPERPAPRGTIRLGYPEEPTTLSPALATTPAARDILRAVLPSFFLVTPDLRYRPYLLAAEPKVRVSGRRMTVRFEIRRDAMWSDGRPITVSDVAFTRGVLSDPGVPPELGDGFDHLVDVVRDGPRSGTLVLEPPYAGWRDLFSAGRFVLPAHAAGRAADVPTWTKGPPVAGGPFRVERWVRGRSVMLVRNRRFFGASPLARRIEVAFVPDPTTAIQLLEAGLLDAVAPMLGVSWGHRLARVPGVETASAFGPDVIHLVINPEGVPLPRRRRQLADAIDREPFVDAVVREEGRGADGVLVPEQVGALRAWARYGGEGAASFIAARELTLVYAGTELLDVAARYVQAELDRAGTDVELVSVPGEEFQETFLPERRYDLALWEARGGPGQWLARWFGPAAVAGAGDGRVVRILARADRGRSRALAEAQRLLARLAPVLPLFQPRVSMGWRAGIAGVLPNPTADGPLWNAWDWSKARGD